MANKTPEQLDSTGAIRVLKPGSMASLVIVVVACGVLASQPGEMSLLSTLAIVSIGFLLLMLLGNALRWQASAGRLADSEARFRALVQQSSDVTLIIDRDGVIRYASPAAIDVFARRAEELAGESIASLSHPDDATSVSRFLQASHTRAETVVAEWRVRRGAGDWVWTENTSSDMLAEPAIRGIVVNCRDVSERRTLQARLTHQAYHDALTQLANRSLFLNRVAQAIARASRGRRASVVLFLDLDDFKKVNDSLGHAAGDELLVASAARLLTCVRPGDTIARLGGDEFAILLDDLDGFEDALVIAERITTALRNPFRLQGRDVFIGVSVGVARVEASGTPDDILRNADLAMYFAKGRDKGRYAVFAPEMHEQLVDRLELEADLRQAVDAGHITVEYQPIVTLDDTRFWGAEALVRWTHSVRGRVPPSRFVAVAEETGLIVSIGRSVLREACLRTREWHGRRRSAPNLRMSVNLSGRHFQEDSVIDDVRAALSESGLPPWFLTLEITESVLMQQSYLTLAKLRELKALGVMLAIDDFGTGYSSLGYLQQFPIDMLKIDRTFVDGVGLEDNDPVLVRAIIALGRTLGMETIAEGIERPEQRDGLRALGCELGQGFLFARPMPPAEFADAIPAPTRGPSVVEMYAPVPLGLSTPTVSATPSRAKDREPA
ncbi:MAG: putative bifunctional diguanylate cyclase/phosphodiesterase [Gemmatimonadota bacterium]